MAGSTGLRFVIPKFASCLQKTTSITVPALLRRRQRCSFNNLQKFCSSAPKPKKETVTVNFIQHDGTKSTVQASVGDNLLDVVIDHDIDLDGFGACEGTLACSTCHLVFKQKDFDLLSDKPTDEELDMLDLAYGLCDTSRLGCQVIVTKEMEGLEVQVPAGVADARDPS